jgi:hypothetical protein
MRKPVKVSQPRPRGRSQITKTAFRRVIDIAREKGVPQLTLELPGGSKVILPLSQDKQTDEKPEDIVDLLK